jgi:hypothetical protein
MKRRKSNETAIAAASVCIAVVAVGIILAMFHFWVDEPLRQAQDDANRNLQETEQILKDAARQRQKITDSPR